MRGIAGRAKASERKKNVEEEKRVAEEKRRAAEAIRQKAKAWEEKQRKVAEERAELQRKREAQMQQRREEAKREAERKRAREREERAKALQRYREGLREKGKGAPSTKRHTVFLLTIESKQMEQEVERAEAEGICVLRDTRVVSNMELDLAVIDHKGDPLRPPEVVSVIARRAVRKGEEGDREQSAGDGMKGGEADSYMLAEKKLP